MNIAPTLPAISIRQPWAWLIVRPDLTDPEERKRHCKNIENRTWKSRFRGRVLIHAALGMTNKEWVNVGMMHPEYNLPTQPDLQFGGIIGMAKIVDAIAPEAWTPDWSGGSKWHMQGFWGYVLEDIRPLPFTPCRGALGFFKPDTKRPPGAEARELLLS